MELAIKYYIEAAKQVEHLLKELPLGPTADHLVFQPGFFQSFVKDANRNLKEASIYISLINK